MIKIFEVKCSQCGIIVHDLCNDKRVPRPDYLCTDCIQKEAIKNMIFEEIEVKLGSTTRYDSLSYKVFMGFKELIPNSYHKNHYIRR